MAETTTIPSQTSAVVTATTSKQWTLNLRDLAKGALVAAITSLAMFIYNWSTSKLGFSDIDWEGVLKGAVAAFIGYLIKNFIEPAKTIVSIVPPEGQLTTQDAVKIKDIVNVEQQKSDDGK